MWLRTQRTIMLTISQMTIADHQLVVLRGQRLDNMSRTGASEGGWCLIRAGGKHVDNVGRTHQHAKGAKRRRTDAVGSCRSTSFPSATTTDVAVSKQGHRRDRRVATDLLVHYFGQQARIYRGDARSDARIDFVDTVAPDLLRASVPPLPRKSCRAIWQARGLALRS